MDRVLQAAQEAAGQDRQAAGQDGCSWGGGVMARHMTAGSRLLAALLVVASSDWAANDDGAYKLCLAVGDNMLICDIKYAPSEEKAPGLRVGGADLLREGDRQPSALGAAALSGDACLHQAALGLLMPGDRDYRAVGKFLHAVIVVGFMVVGIEYENDECLWMKSLPGGAMVVAPMTTKRHSRVIRALGVKPELLTHRTNKPRPPVAVAAVEPEHDVPGSFCQRVQRSSAGLRAGAFDLSLLNVDHGRGVRRA